MKTLVFPGTPIADAKRRQVGRGFWLPSISDQGVLSASSSRINATATASATPHTFGVWQELIAATTKEAHVVTLTLLAGTSTSANNTSTLLSLSAGASGHETDAGQVIVANLAVGYRLAVDHYTIPVTIPPGTRLSVAVQSAIASKAVQVGVTLGTLPYGRRPANHVVTMGADTSTSHGVGLTAPGSANVKTAWTQIVASTIEPFGALIVGEQANADISISSGFALLDIGVGAAGNETVIGADIAYQVSVTENMVGMSPRLIPADIPLGSRLAARWSADSTADSMDLILYGVPRQ